MPQQTPRRNSLAKAYAGLHKDHRFPGYSIEPFLPQITKLVKESGARTLLDYGCGEGKQYHEHEVHKAWKIVPHLYDPGVKKYRRLPTGPFDGVICTDVLEHVPITELPDVIEDLARLSTMWCFISVCCRPSKNKFLPDGRNVHVTIRPPEWWQKVLKEAFAGRAALHLDFTP